MTGPSSISPLQGPGGIHLTLAPFHHHILMCLIATDLGLVNELDFNSI